MSKNYSIALSGPMKGRRVKDPFRAKKRKPTVKSVAKSIKKIQGQQELKHIDFYTSSGFQAIPTTGLITCINTTVNGTTNITRIGDDITATSIQFRGLFQSNELTLNTSTIRHIVLWDSQPNGALPALADVLDVAVITVPIYAPYNENFQKRFKILYDRVYTITPQVYSSITAGTIDNVLEVKKYSRLKRKLSRQVKYNGNTGGIADIETNSLINIFVSDQATNPPTVEMGHRLYYKD